jgi:putative FmdB family regulatory protein
MPTYEYQCTACGEKFELFQSISAKPVKKCPACGKNAARRLISAGAGIIFKGSGFYETDYRSESYKSAAKKEAPASDGGKSDGSKSAGDGKSEAATAASATKDTAAPAAESKPVTPAKKSGKAKS